MKITGLDNREYSWNIVKYNKKSENCSSLHLRARLLLARLFPYDPIFEEVVLPGIKTEINNRPLLLDFYIHFRRLAVEVQGTQHTNFTPFFHGNKIEYFRAKKLDQLKHQWCSINNIRLVELPYNKTDIEWEGIIKC